MTPSQAQRMQCMEVWGGNQPTNKGVVMAGLDAWVYSRPHGGSAGGGDVYYVSSCATDRILRLLIADVSGHGQTVDDIAVELRRLMRRYVNHIDQVQFVRALNRRFAALEQAGMFATAVVSTFFAPTNRLTLCNAGHPPPLLFRAATGQWSYLQSRADEDGAGRVPMNLPLGIADAADYQTFDVPLQVGDLVLCYTDSLIEAYDCGGEMLGQEGLLKLARGLDPADATALIPALLDAVAAQADGNLTADDVTVLLFRPNGLGRRRPSLGQQVTAVGRLLGAIARSFRPGSDPIPWPDFKLANLGGAMIGRMNRLWSTPRNTGNGSKR